MVNTSGLAKFDLLEKLFRAHFERLDASRKQTPMSSPLHGLLMGACEHAGFLGKEIAMLRAALERSTDTPAKDVA